jgi:hypothetical protein
MPAISMMVWKPLCIPVVRAGSVARRVAANDGETPATPEEVKVLQKAERELEERIHHIDLLEQLQLELEVAGSRLVVLDIMADGVCESGLLEPDDGWTPDRQKKEEAKLAVCSNIRHQFVCFASDSPNVRFLETVVCSSPVLPPSHGQCHNQ